MKKMLLSLAITAALTGCGGGETLQDIKNETPVLKPAIAVKFDPSSSVVSVPNDLLMSGTKDGTLNMPGEFNAQGQAMPRTAYANPQVALGALDGWSTQLPYVIDLAIPQNVSLDASSVAMPDSVRIFEVTMGASQTDTDCAQVPAGIACKVVGELSFGQDFISKANSTNNGIMVVPIKPFKPATTYITVLTTQLKDSEGRSIEASSTYTLVRQDGNLVTDAQKGLQAVIRSYENALESQTDVTKADIIYTAAMTTQSAGQVLGTVKKLLAAGLQQNQLPTIQVPAQPTITVANVFAAAGMTNIPVPFSGVQYLKGSIALPSYLAKPQATGIDALADTYWQGMCDSAVTVLGYKAQAGDSFPAEPQTPSDAVCAALSGGALRDLGLDPTRHLTKYNSIPKTQWLANIPVQITKPMADLQVINAVRAQLGMPALSMPATGWPVVILQHGITSKKEDMLALTAALTIQGFATVAIDHPMHGERGIDVDGDGTDDFNATTKSVLAYMNLSSLLVARDNLRQSVADLLGLRLGLHTIAQTQGLNSLDVSFVGHSLGSIVAPGFIAQANTPLNPAIDGLFKVNTVALASGGGGIASFLLESGSFGSFIQGSVLASAGNLLAKEFNAYLAEGAVANCAATLPNQEAFLTCGFKSYVADKTAAGDTKTLAGISSLMSQFVFAAQTALDAGDPTNYAAAVKATGTPIYMNVVVGNDDGNKPDTVIPPTTANPLAGSLPLAGYMGLQAVSTSQPVGAPASYVVKFSQGHHGSVLTPAYRAEAGGTELGHALANQEMQYQVAAYLASRGSMLPILDSRVIAE
ncbi:VolA/Pla-1 family phospholipase [Pseudoalteromonas fenneropenaei]|uniref:VolA/Pla-1 family phospholipase n=1 Tax=Pseudoalteromonas fenneropenaei TaxID=1737459 RepID=A0ABV7CQK6_9GAMM